MKGEVKRLALCKKLPPKKSLKYVSTVSLKIDGTLFCPLAFAMLVYKIWWVNWDRQHLGGQGDSQKHKKLFLSETVG